MTTDKTAYHPLGASGLKISKLLLGTMMFGDQTDAAQAANIVAATMLAACVASVWSPNIIVPSQSFETLRPLAPSGW